MINERNHRARTSIVLGFLVLVAFGQGSAESLQKPHAAVRLAVVGESNLRTGVIESLKEASEIAGIEIDVVPKTGPVLNFTLIIAQQTTIGSAAAAVIALDHAGDVAASWFVRAGSPGEAL